MTPRLHPAWPLLGVVTVLGLTGCSGPGVGEPTVAPTAPTSTGTSLGSMDCGDASLLTAPGEALVAFPDNPDVDWTARPSSSSLAELVLVSLTPEPAEVGYPEFQFVYRCDAEGPSRIATYALDGESLVLLATTDALADEELPESIAVAPTP